MDDTTTAVTTVAAPVAATTTPVAPETVIPLTPPAETVTPVAADVAAPIAPVATTPPVVAPPAPPAETVAPETPPVVAPETATPIVPTVETPVETPTAPPVDTNPASAGLRSEIAKLVVKFKALDVVTPEMSVRFDAYLTAEEVDLPKIHDTLTTAAAEIDQIEAQATAEEQKLLAEYMAEMKLIEKEAKKITLQFEEAVDKDADEAKEAQLLEEVNKV